MQIFEIKKISDIRTSEYLQNLKDTVFQAGKDLFGEVWDGSRGTEESGNMTDGGNTDERSRNAAENDQADEGSENAAENDQAGEGSENAAENDQAGEGSENAAENGQAGEGSENVATESFAGEDELTEETAAAIESLQKITVLITNKGEGGYWHSTLSFSFAADVVLTTGEGVTYLKSGETLELDASDYTVGESFSLEKVSDVSGENGAGSSEEESAAGAGSSEEESAASAGSAEEESTAGVKSSEEESAVGAGSSENERSASSDNGADYAAFTLDFSAEKFSAEKLSAGTGSSDTRTYAGTMEITVTENGFLLRNTLPLEEYLRYVVPAEMPASYPEEALKAQAICARTYALKSAMSGTFAAYGADISDDTSCQVYNTQGTDERTDAAVLATAGEYLIFDGEPAESYYFSTSCGVTTDAAIWGEEISYLKSVLVSGFSAEETGTETEEALAEETGTETEEALAEETGVKIGGASAEETEIGEHLREEDCLRCFLSDTASGAESDETWYRWEAVFPMEVLKERLGETIGEILAVEVTQRGSGGVATELTIYGSSGQEVIESQYAIREFFRLGGGAVCTVQGGTVYSDSMLLPSAFFYIQTEADGTVTLVGGGYGHGCGMSQNAAKAYAKEGADAYEILAFFYSGTKIYVAAAE